MDEFDRVVITVREMESKLAAEMGKQRFVHNIKPRVGVILGSGLGGFVDGLADRVAVPYSDFKYLTTGATKGHGNQLVLGKCGRTPVLVLQGRVHPYEGVDNQILLRPARALVKFGCDVVIITNAAGGVNHCLEPGDLVVGKDYINLSGCSPLVGPNDERFAIHSKAGQRFPDMSQAYDPELRQLVRHLAWQEMGLKVRPGIYVWMMGPCYETPAEVEMIRRAGGDLAGMSNVSETMAVRHMGARVISLTCVTNKAAGLQDKLDHEEVKEQADKAGPQFNQLLSLVVQNLFK